MAYQISSSCIGCHACKNVCPSNAVVVDGKKFTIAQHRCDECQSQPHGSQCAAICPVETAIVDAKGRALNPPGSLTGISQESLIKLTPCGA